MQKPLVFINAVILLLLLAVTGMIGHKITSDSAEYSYVIVSPEDSKLIEELNKLGASGYQIVASRRAVGSEGKGASYELIMQRKGAIRSWVSR